MNKLYNVFKIIFHFSNIVLIFFYLFPGSILGWFLYKDLELQPQITNDFIGISSNHFYAFFVLSFLIIFIGNYSYGMFKLSSCNFKSDNEINVKIISPNFSLKDYNTQSEEFQIKRLIKISDPKKDKKTLFIWPEGIFYQSYLEDIKKYQNLFKDKFSENHLIILGINNFTSTNDQRIRNILIV